VWCILAHGPLAERKGTVAPLAGTLHDTGALFATLGGELGSAFQAPARPQSRRRRQPPPEAALTAAAPTTRVVHGVARDKATGTRTPNADTHPETQRNNIYNCEHDKLKQTH